jgi:hypothetical protein
MFPPDAPPTHFPTGFGKETGLPPNKWASDKDSAIHRPATYQLEHPDENDHDVDFRSSHPTAAATSNNAMPAVISTGEAAPVYTPAKIKKPFRHRWERFVKCHRAHIFKWQRNTGGPAKAEPKHDLTRSGNPNEEEDLRKEKALYRKSKKPDDADDNNPAGNAAEEVDFDDLGENEDC